MAVAKTGSFTKAAGKLFLSQPSVSGHISKLEQELGITLFHRDNKSIELTDAGKIFFSHATEILNQKQKTLLNLNKYTGKIEGILEIGASNTTAQYILPRYLADFRKKYPGVIFNLLQMSSKHVETSLLNGELDFGLVGSRAQDKNLIYEKLAEDTLVAIAPPKAPFTEMDSISLCQLLKYPIVVRREGSATRKLFEDALEKSGKIKDLKIAAYFDTAEMVALSVQHGLGLAIVSAISVEEKLKNSALLSLPINDLDLNRSFYFSYHKNRTLSPLTLCFKDFMLKK